MKTTQSSEGMNAFLRSRVIEYNTLFKFVIRFESVLRRQCEKENTSDFVNNHYIQQMVSKLSIEKHVYSLYTTKVFHMFQEQLKESLY